MHVDTLRMKQKMKAFPIALLALLQPWMAATHTAVTGDLEQDRSYDATSLMQIERSLLIQAQTSGDRSQQLASDDSTLETSAIKDLLSAGDDDDNDKDTTQSGGAKADGGGGGGGGNAKPSNEKKADKSKTGKDAPIVKENAAGIAEPGTKRDLDRTTKLANKDLKEAQVKEFGGPATTPGEIEQVKMQAMSEEAQKEQERIAQQAQKEQQDAADNERAQVDSDALTDQLEEEARAEDTNQEETDAETLERDKEGNAGHPNAAAAQEKADGVGLLQSDFDVVQRQLSSTEAEDFNDGYRNGDDDDDDEDEDADSAPVQFDSAAGDDDDAAAAAPAGAAAAGAPAPPPEPTEYQKAMMARAEKAEKLENSSMAYVLNEEYEIYKHAQKAEEDQAKAIKDVDKKWSDVARFQAVCKVPLMKMWPGAVTDGVATYSTGVASWSEGCSSGAANVTAGTECKITAEANFVCTDPGLCDFNGNFAAAGGCHPATCTVPKIPYGVGSFAGQNCASEATDVPSGVECLLTAAGGHVCTSPGKCGEDGKFAVADAKCQAMCTVLAHRVGAGGTWGGDKCAAGAKDVVEGTECTLTAAEGYACTGPGKCGKDGRFEKEAECHGVCTIPEIKEGVKEWVGANCSSEAKKVNEGTACIIIPKDGYNCVSPSLCGSKGKFLAEGKCTARCTVPVIPWGADTWEGELCGSGSTSVVAGTTCKIIANEGYTCTDPGECKEDGTFAAVGSCTGGAAAAAKDTLLF